MVVGQSAENTDAIAALKAAVALAVLSAADIAADVDSALADLDRRLLVPMKR